LPTVKLSPVVRREQIDVTLHRRDRTTRTRHGQAGTKVGRTSPSCTGVLAGVISNGGTVTAATRRSATTRSADSARLSDMMIKRNGDGEPWQAYRLRQMSQGLGD
jgi:hypothetical protein